MEQNPDSRYETVLIEDRWRDPRRYLPCCSKKIRQESSKSGKRCVSDAPREMVEFSTGKARIAEPLISVVTVNPGDRIHLSELKLNLYPRRFGSLS